MKPSQMSKIIGENIRNIRKSRSLSVQQTAEYLGVKPDTYRHYERGERTVSVEDMIALSEFFHCSEQNILNGLVEKRKNTSANEIRYLDDYESKVMRYMATDFKGNPKSTIVALDVFMQLRPERRREVIMALCLQKDEAEKHGEVCFDDIRDKIEYLHDCLGFMYEEG